MQDVNDFKPQNLSGIEFIAIVVNNKDPLKKARVQLRIPGIYDDVSDSDLPWARGNTTIGGVNIPRIGKRVVAYLDQGLKENPVYGHEIVMADSIKGTPMDEDYPNTIGFFDGTNFVLLNRIKNKITLHAPNSTITLGNSGISGSTSGDVLISGRNITANATANATISAVGNAELSAGGNAEISAGGDVDVTAGGNANIKGTTIFLN